MPSKRKSDFQKKLEKVRLEQIELERKEEVYLQSMGLFIPDITFVGYTTDDVEECGGKPLPKNKPVKSKWTVGTAEKDGTFKREDLLIYYNVLS